jgi:hypothetical protein
MEPDDLLCSRNARPQKALVGRALLEHRKPSSLSSHTSPKLARVLSPGMAPVLVSLRPSSEHILIVRAPGARDQHECYSSFTAESRRATTSHLGFA